MTDTYRPDASSWDNVIKWSADRRRKVASDVVDGVDGDPDEAARAVRLSQTTGDPAAIINMDVDDYANQMQKNAASEIVGRNDVLRRWVEDNPMAAKVAADDWSAIDNYDEKLKKLHLFNLPGAESGGRITRALARGFREEFDTSRVSHLDELSTKSLASWLMLYPIDIAATLGFRTISAIGYGALPEAASQLSKELGATDTRPDMVKQGMKGFAEYIMTHPGFHAIPLQEGAVAKAQAARTAETIRLVKPYIEAGEPVPQGLSYLADQYNATLARLQRESLTEAEKAADSTNLKGRSPEIFNDFTKLRGELNVELSAEAALRLYGDKIPHSDDGLLGFVKDIEMQLAAARDYEDRVKIPLNDWNTLVDPEVRKALEKDVTVIRNGMTPEEADRVPPQPLDIEPPVPPGTVRLYRGDTGIKGLAPVPDYIKETPEHKAIVEATGRWFVADRSVAKYYNQTFGDKSGRISYVDIPAADAEKYLASKQPEAARFSAAGRAEEEHFLPRAIANQARTLEPGPLEPVPVDQSSAGKFSEALQAERRVTKSDPLFECMSPCKPKLEDFPFEIDAIMPKDRQALYAKRMEEQQAHNDAALKRKIEQDTKRRVGEKWDEAKVAVLHDVEKEVNGRPEFLIDDLFRNRTLAGQKLAEMPKIDPKFLTEEQKKLFPKAFMKKGGLNPDEVSSLFGLQSGDEMIGRYASYLQAKGDLRPAEFRTRMIGDEMERRLTAMFGDPAEVALQDAREHMYGDKNLDMLHEDTVAMGMAAGQKIPLSKEDMIRQTKRRFDKMIVEDVDYPSIGAKVYRNASKLEERLLVKDAVGAFKYAQGKEAQYALGLELKDFLKDKKSLETLTKRYAKREIDNRDTYATNFIHQILNQLGETTRRGDADIAGEIAKSPYKDLRDFVDQLRAEGYDIHMPDFLYDPNFKKPLEKMTTEEYRGVHDAIKSIDKYSQTLHQRIVAGDLWDHNELINHLSETMIESGAKGEELQIDLPEGAFKQAIKTYWASTIQLEALFNRFDRNNPYGIFNQAIVRKYVESSNKSDFDNKRFGKMIRELSPIRYANKIVAQNLFINPRTGEPMRMIRMNILAVLQNMGNPGNFYGMLDGWKIPRERANEVMQLVRDNTYPEDWKRAEQLGQKIFGLAKEENDVMRRRLSGVAPAPIELWNIVGHDGKEYKGWYHPIIYDTDLYQKSEKLSAPNVLEYPYWAKSVMPSASFAKQRTGYVGYYSLNFDGVQSRLQDMVHDTAWRETLTDLQRIFKDHKFRDTLKATQGSHMVNLLDPFLKDLSGKTDVLDKNLAAATKMLLFVRQNLISHLVGFNPATWAKHTTTAAINSLTEVGAVPFLKSLLTIVGQSPIASENNWTFAMNKSLELSRRHRNFYENISSNFTQTYGHLRIANDMKEFLSNFEGRPFTKGLAFTVKDLKGNYMELRDAMHWVEAAPLAYWDLFSAVPTWLAAYRREIGKGASEGDAVFIADRSVRFAHGSTAITNRSQIMRSNPLAASFATFYGFFNHILMKQYQMAWAMRDVARGEGFYAQPPTINRDTGDIRPPSLVRGSREKMKEMEAEYKKTDEYKEGAAIIPVMAGMLVSYAFAPAIVDEWVSPEHREEGPLWEHGPYKDENTAMYAAKVMAKGLSGGLWGLRDAVHAAVQGGDVTSGIYGSGFKYGVSQIRDWNQMVNKTHPTLKDKERWIKDQNDFWNVATGIALPHSVPRAGLFGADWYIGKEKPQNLRQWWTGITQGTAHPSRRHR